MIKAAEERQKSCDMEAKEKKEELERKDAASKLSVQNHDGGLEAMKRAFNMSREAAVLQDPGEKSEWEGSMPALVYVYSNVFV